MTLSCSLNESMASLLTNALAPKTNSTRHLDCSRHQAQAESLVAQLRREQERCEQLAARAAAAEEERGRLEREFKVGAIDMLLRRARRRVRPRL